MDGSILAASHGTKRLTEFEIDKVYGRCRKKHAANDFVQHLNEFGPQKLVEFSPLLHNFMDYFDIAAPLICTRFSFLRIWFQALLSRKDLKPKK